jgi:hypothetical protein
MGKKKQIQSGNLKKGPRTGTIRRTRTYNLTKTTGENKKERKTKQKPRKTKQKAKKKKSPRSDEGVECFLLL